MDNGQFKEFASAAKYYVDLVDIDKEFRSVSGEDGESDNGISGKYQRKGKEHKYTSSTDAPSPLPIPPPSASPSSHIRTRHNGSGWIRIAIPAWQYPTIQKSL